MLQNITALLLLLVSFHSVAQINSYDFSSPLSPNGIEANTVSKSYFGTYKLNDKTFIFDETGVYSKNTIYLTISKATIRENSKYSIRNNYLFGVKENDSIFCFLEGDKYYYGLKEKIEIIGKNSDNKLIDDGSCYYINFYDDGRWTPAKLEFNSEKLTVYYFDYPTETDVFNGIKNTTKKVKNGLNNIRLSPTEKEWETIDKTIIFPTSEVFLKEG